MPLQATLFPRTNYTYRYLIRSPQTEWFLKRAGRCPLGKQYRDQWVSNITYKEAFHIAKQKSTDPQFIGVPLKTIVGCVIALKARSLTQCTKLVLPTPASPRKSTWWRERGMGG